jgi:hypothetical protein
MLTEHILMYRNSKKQHETNGQHFQILNANNNIYNMSVAKLLIIRMDQVTNRGRGTCACSSAGSGW